MNGEQLEEGEAGGRQILKNGINDSKICDLFESRTGLVSIIQHSLLNRHYILTPEPEGYKLNAKC